MSKQEVYFKTEIVERPCKENELTAIVRAEYQSERSKISGFGYADAESAKSKSPKKIMDIARNEALKRVKNEAMRDTTHGAKTTANSDAKVSIPAQQPATQQAQNPASALPWNSQASSTPNKSYAHNPRKTASQRQIDLLLSLAKEKGIHLGSIAQERYGKSIEELNSPEANALIQELK